jgi:hypothetical protein
MLRDAARWAALAAVGAVAAILFRRARALDPEDHRCRGAGVCRACGDLGRCPLPQALSARAALERNRAGREGS